jgi:hypothetical protein
MKKLKARQSYLFWFADCRMRQLVAVDFQFRALAIKSWLTHFLFCTLYIKIGHVGTATVETGN